MSANETQVGGVHYKSGYQHWDWVEDMGLPYLPAQVIKYLSRWKKKNGIQDLEKAAHFLDKYIEALTARLERYNMLGKTFAEENEIGVQETAIMENLTGAYLGHKGQLLLAKRLLAELIVDVRNTPKEDPIFKEDRDEWKTKSTQSA